MVPATSTGLDSVTVTPGTAAPWPSATLTRMDPVCTCAAADTAAIATRPRAANQPRTRFIDLSSGKTFALLREFEVEQACNARSWNTVLTVNDRTASQGPSGLPEQQV